MLLFYVRHGDPIYEPDSLTPLGHRQAESVARRLALFGVDEVYASTSTRAMQTAQPLCELLHKELKTLEFLHEDHVEPLRLREEGKDPIWIWTHPYYSGIFARRDVREMGDKWYTHPEFEAFHFEKVILPIQQKMDEFFTLFNMVDTVPKATKFRDFAFKTGKSLAGDIPKIAKTVLEVLK